MAGSTTKTIAIITAILSLDNNAKVTVIDEDVDNLIWKEDYQNPNNITKEQIATKLAELQTESDAQDYARKREAEYPSVQDLVVALYDTEDKIAIDIKRAEIKLKYPKPVA